MRAEKFFLIVVFLFVSLNSKSIYVGWDGDGDDDSTGLTFGKRLATIYRAFDPTNSDRAVGGDSILICGTLVSKIHTIATPCTLRFLNPPTVAAPVYMLGADSVGVAVDSGWVTKVTTGSDINSIFLIQNTVDSCRNIYIKNLLIDGGGSGGADYGVKTSDAAQYTITISDCRITNCAVDGVIGRFSPSNSRLGILIHNEIDNNGKSGTGKGVNYLTNSYEGFTIIERNKIHHNPTGGVYTGVSTMTKISSNLIYKCGSGDGINIAYASAGVPIYIEENCIDSCSDGIDLITGLSCTLVNNIVSYNLAYGIKFNGSDLDRIIFSAHNGTYGNGTAATDAAGGILPGYNNKTTNPEYTNHTPDNEDYTPTNTDYKNSGLNLIGY